MSSTLTELSPRRAAVIAGLAYVAIIVLGLFANFFALARLVEPGDAAATASSISGSEGLFRAGIAAFAAVFALDVVLAWALYVFFKPANRGLSLLAAWFRLVTAAIGAAALLNLLVAVRLVDGTGYASALEAGQRATQAMLSLDAYHYGFTIALAFFGVYLLLLGFVAVRSDYVPRVVGVLVTLAGLAYVVNSLARVLLTSYEDYQGFLQPPFFLLALAGEFSLTGWLLLRGGREEAREAASVPA